MTTPKELYSKIISKATLGQVEQAATWYLDAEKIANKVADNLDTTLEVGASVVSAFSPRERWSTNVEKAVAFSLGKEVRGLRNNLRMAQNSLDLGFEALRGLKTNAFAKAIAGDANAIVIDVWMCRAAGKDYTSPNQSQYYELSKAVEDVAKKHGLTPRVAQAIIWIVYRGSAY